MMLLAPVLAAAWSHLIDLKPQLTPHAQEVIEMGERC
jgi:hypothetical protein